MTDPKPESPPPIDYAPSARRRGWSKKYLIAGLMFLAAVAFVYEWPQVQRFHAITQAYMWQRRAMSFMLPKGTIVYSDKPAEIQKLRASPDYFSPGQNDLVFYDAAPLREMLNWRRRYAGAPIHRIPSGGIFLHSRTQPDGQKRLVAIAAFPFDPPNMSPRYLILRSQVIRPGSLTRLWQMPSGVALLNLPLKPSDRITLFAGQPDPADASHFTIDYVLNQDSGTIDGWLRAHGTIDLRPRQGAITSHPAGAPAMIWRPLATTAPITNPASHLPATLPSPR